MIEKFMAVSFSFQPRNTQCKERLLHDCMKSLTRQELHVISTISMEKNMFIISFGCLFCEQHKWPWITRVSK